MDGRFDCPNRDGTVQAAGCIFCDPRSFSPSRRLGLESIAQQIAEGTRRLSKRYRVDRFVAYFQPATTTYAPVSRLRSLYQEALDQPGIVGMAVGTRPDCVGDDVLDLLAELSERTWVSLEFGLQSIHDRSLAWLNRGHRYDAFLDAVRRSRLRRLNVGAHVILCLPGETREDMLATARELARLKIDSVKLHNLHAVKDTPLADMVAAGRAATSRVDLPSRDEYVDCVVGFLEQLPPHCVIDRLSGEAPPEYLVGPAWCLEKAAVRRAIEAELLRRDTWQGRKLGRKRDQV